MHAGETPSPETVSAAVSRPVIVSSGSIDKLIRLSASSLVTVPLRAPVAPRERDPRAWRKALLARLHAAAVAPDVPAAGLPALITAEAPVTQPEVPLRSDAFVVAAASGTVLVSEIVEEGFRVSPAVDAGLAGGALSLPSSSGTPIVVQSRTEVEQIIVNRWTGRGIPRTLLSEEFIDLYVDLIVKCSSETQLGGVFRHFDQACGKVVAQLIDAGIAQAADFT